MNQFMINRRRLLAGTAGVAALAVAGLPAVRASASHYDRYDTVAAYEKAWAGTDTSVPNNEAGGLAWGISYLLLSLVRMYQATGDTTYLDRFVERADQVWAQTDVRREVTDHAGRSGWVWRTGGNYTSAAATVTDAAGAPLFEIRYAWTYPTDGKVTVSNVTATGFDLVLTHPRVATKTLTGVNFDPDSPDFVVRRVNEDVYSPNVRWTAKDVSSGAGGTPVAGTTGLAQQYYAFAVHTGMVTYPMALFSRLMLQQGSVRYRGAAQRYLAWTHKAVAFHDREWKFRELADGSTGGDYVWPTGAAVPFDGLIQPFNQTQGLGQTMAELHRISPQPAYAAKVEAMVRAFRSDVEVVGEAWQWHYWPTYSELYNSYDAESGLSEYTPWYGRATQYEDISHAAITVEFLNAAHGAGLGATDDDLAHLGATYTDNVAVDPTHVATRVSGGDVASDSVAAQAGRWLTLQPVEPTMADHIHAVYAAMDLEPLGGSRMLGVSYLVWARNAGWESDAG
ncbi:hypothetical protein ACQBAU_11655 [Propionibacteriaceae bacterium Y2011]|uniref:hypothetical protein n=1 Tax=Microlunatus sp. Y2014 TaxID=3418488 RepID=UPI003B4D74C0